MAGVVLGTKLQLVPSASLPVTGASAKGTMRSRPPDQTAVAPVSVSQRARMVAALSRSARQGEKASPAARHQLW